MPAVEGDPPGKPFEYRGVDLVYSGLSAWSPPFGEADFVEIDLQPVRAERNLNPNVDFTGRSIPSHAPRRIISTDPLQRYYETKSGTRLGNFRPGFSFGTILLSHNSCVTQNYSQRRVNDTTNQPDRLVSTWPEPSLSVFESTGSLYRWLHVLWWLIDQIHLD